MGDQFDSTGWYHAHGWRRDCNGKWYPPDRSPGPGWQLSSDNVWHPPGWWLSSDGNWYPPDRSPGPGWQLSSDNVWHPPGWWSARVANAVSYSAATLFYMGLGIGLLAGDDDGGGERVAVGLAVVLMAVGFGLGCTGLVLAARGFRSQPDRERARSLASGTVAAASVVPVVLMIWLQASSDGASGLLHVVLALDLLLGVLAGVVWPLDKRRRL